MTSDVGRWVGQRGSDVRSDVRSDIFDFLLNLFIFRLKGHSQNSQFFIILLIAIGKSIVLFFNNTYVLLQ